MSETRYTKDHEWVRLDGTTATVGITDHAEEALGDIVFVELPEPGREVAAGGSLAVVERVKAASDVYAPLTGTIAEVNAAVVDHPAKVNAGAEGEAWFFSMTIPQVSEFEALMDKDAYAAFVETL